MRLGFVGIVIRGKTGIRQKCHKETIYFFQQV